MFYFNHEYFMSKAIDLANISYSEKEVPVGSVIVKDNMIIAMGRNRRELSKNALLHAEITAINNACEYLERWRLSGCTLYVTLEPCPMCAGAIINSRIDTLVFGAYDKKAGASGSVINLFDYPFNHKPQIISQVLQHECSSLLSSFFLKLRNKSL